MAATPSTTSSYLLCWTYRRDPATQHCPWLKKIALAAPSMASGPASSNTMLGLLPPSSRVSFFRLLAPAAATISLPTSVEPVKATLSTSLMRGQRCAGGLAKARYHVHDAVGHAGLGNQPGQPQRGQRGLLGRLEHHAVTRGQGWPELPGRHQQREVPRDDLPTTPSGSRSV